MEYKSFNNERDARIYRDSKRDEGHAASLFTYSKDRHRVQVDECATKEEQQKNQRWLSNKAWNVSRDIEDLTKVKELIASPDFGSEIEDVTFVAKKLDSGHWFPTTSSVVSFFDYPADSIEKIKEMVDTALEDYGNEWNEYLKMQGVAPH